KPTPEEIAESQVSQEDRLRKMVAESRWLAYVAAGLLGVSVIAGIVSLLTRRPTTKSEEPTSWALLISMTTLMAAVIFLAVGCLRSSEAGILAVLGLREPKVSPIGENSSAEKLETPATDVDWSAQLSPRGAETRIGDNLKFLIDRERGGPIA